MAVLTVTGSLFMPYLSSDATMWQVAGVGGAVYTPDGEIDPQPSASWIDQVTVVSATPVAVATKPSKPEGAIRALLGRTSKPAEEAAELPLAPAQPARAAAMAMTVTLQGKAQRWSSGMGAAFRWVENYELRENVKE